MGLPRDEAMVKIYEEKTGLINIKEPVFIELLTRGRVNPSINEFCYPSYTINLSTLNCRSEIGIYVRDAFPLIGEIGIFLFYPEVNLPTPSNVFFTCYSEKKSNQTDFHKFFIPFFNTKWDKAKSQYHFIYQDLYSFLKWLKKQVDFVMFSDVFNNLIDQIKHIESTHSKLMNREAVERSITAFQKLGDIPSLHMLSIFAAKCINEEGAIPNEKLPSDLVDDVTNYPVMHL